MPRASPRITKVLCTTQVLPHQFPRPFHPGEVHPFQPLGSPAAHAGPPDRSPDRSPDRPLAPGGPGVPLVQHPVPLQVAECDDGKLRLYFGGQPLWDRAWSVSEIDDCISCFLATSHSLRLGEKVESTIPQCGDPPADSHTPHYS